MSPALDPSPQELTALPAIGVGSHSRDRSKPVLQNAYIGLPKRRGPAIAGPRHQRITSKLATRRVTREHRERTADVRRGQRAHEREVVVEGRTNLRLDAAVPEPLGEDLVLGVVLAVVVVAVGRAFAVAVQAEPRADDRIANLQLADAAGLPGRRSRPRLDGVGEVRI